MSTTSKDINIPQGVNVKFDKSSFIVEVSGPKGTVADVFDGANIAVNNDKLSVSLDNSKFKSSDVGKILGLYYVLIKNMIKGVSTGFKKSLDLIGKGYKAALINKGVIEFDLGFSHKVLFCIPDGITCEIKSDKVKNIVTICGSDKALVGQISAKIRDLRPVEPYKGNGFRYTGEDIKLKVGKKVK